MEQQHHGVDDEVFFDLDDAEVNATSARGGASPSSVDGLPNMATTNSVGVSNMFSPLPSSRMSDNDRLERSGRWLQSIPRDDVIALQQTLEYHEFLRAFDRLGQAHRKVVALNRSLMSLEENAASASAILSETKGPQQHPPVASSFSFLQHLAVDDVILRVFEFLECHSLIRLSRTCSRFRELAYRSATQRTFDVATARQLNNVMKLLRAKEQIDGVSNNIHDSHVRVPMLGLSRRIYVTDAGDTEYNGVYYCTGNSGNGFVFTKPRTPERRVQWNIGMDAALRPDNWTSNTVRIPGGVDVPGQQQNQPQQQQQQQQPQQAGRGDQDEDDDHNDNNQEGLEDETAKPGQILRCIIAKRFSRETILWYMSKEVEVENNENDNNNNNNNNNITNGVKVVQRFDFWAKLMVTGDASPDICRYPSQTSILSRNGDPAWQPLSTNPTLHPPTVELLD